MRLGSLGKLSVFYCLTAKRVFFYFSLTSSANGVRIERYWICAFSCFRTLLLVCFFPLGTLTGIHVASVHEQLRINCDRNFLNERAVNFMFSPVCLFLREGKSCITDFFECYRTFVGAHNVKRMPRLGTKDTRVRIRPQ